jgi:RNA polymerase sigma-70 factor, ECF subfamily
MSLAQEVDVASEAGREAVLREFVRNRSALFALVLSLVRDFTLSEEVLQEVAVVVCDQWKDFKPGTNFVAWAMRIARNKIFNLTRVARREIVLAPEALEEVERASAVEVQSGWLEALQKCMEGLEGRAGEMLVLRYREGLSGQEIAQRLKTTVTAVHMSLSRARSAVGRCVQGRLAEGEASS